MEWDITYLRNNKLSHFLDDSDVYHPVFTVVGNSSEEVVAQVKGYISDLMMTNCFSVEEGPDSLRVFDPSDGETVETFTEFRAQRMYSLIGCDGKPYLSSTPGILGGHRKLKIYGRLDCPSANRHIANGHYVAHRVFFANEETAVMAGYRPCAVCMAEQYKKWKSTHR